MDVGIVTHTHTHTHTLHVYVVFVKLHSCFMPAQSDLVEFNYASINFKFLDALVKWSKCSVTQIMSAITVLCHCLLMITIARK